MKTQERDRDAPRPTDGAGRRAASSCMRSWLWVAAALASLSFAGAGDDARPIAGVASHGGRPVVGAVVRVPGQAISATTDEKGAFRMTVPAAATTIAFAKPGFRIATAAVDAKPLTVQLEALPHDHEDYAWIDPTPHALQAQNCGNCHGALSAEWSRSAHGRSAKNPRFLSLFSGDDGKHKSWNVQAEHPLGAGVCAACHAPTLKSADLSYDIRQAKGTDAHGIHCDYCHKIADAPTDKLGTRFGRDGLVLVRPGPGDRLSFGPLDDAVRPGESFSFAPVYRDSRYCASCHEGVVFGVRAYGTYSEWQASPAKKEGKQCQSCHMPPPTDRTNIAPNKGGIERRAETLSRHDFPGATAELLKKSVKADIRAERGRDAVEVEVRLVAENVGHKTPTGFADRHLMLLVEGTDAAGKEAALLRGDVLPRRAGSAAGKPGRLFGNQHLNPAGDPLPFWVPEGTWIDSRLAPGNAESATWRFAPSIRSVRIRVVHRRFWPIVAETRGWKDYETVIVDRTVEAP